MKLELVIENFEGARLALEYGFDSIEINSGLYLGGLTPSIGLLDQISQLEGIEKIAMIRPRSGGFIYSQEEYETMKKDLEKILSMNIDGIAFGVLNKDLEIDKVRTKEFVDYIHKANKKAVFHRAVDNTKDYDKAIRDLIELKVDRVLTSGQGQEAKDGVDQIKKIQDLYVDKIEILVGAGVTGDNILDLVKKTGVRYFHSSCKKKEYDKSSSNNVDFSLGDFDYQSIDENLVKALASLK